LQRAVAPQSGRLGAVELVPVPFTRLLVLFERLGEPAVVVDRLALIALLTVVL
jgi:hypothetical protein